MTAFSWKNLQAELSASVYLSPEDDILSQRGIIATAMAIADRMTNSEVLREVTWKPVRLSLKSNEVSIVSTKDPLKPVDSNDKGLKVLSAKPLPRKPLSPVAVKLPCATITW